MKGFIYSARNELVKFIEAGVIAPDKINDALTLLHISPDNNKWREFIDVLLLWIGCLALSFSVLFFIAYNWDDIGRFAKFGMIELLIVLAIAVYWKWDVNTVVAKASLLVATILLGVLLALYGQIYQTGADPWQLFFNWALLMLPWALIGHFSVIWVVWILLLNLSLILYYQTSTRIFGIMFSSQMAMYWQLFGFNLLALLSWEFLATKWEWLETRWAVRLVTLGCGIPITLLVLYSIFDRQVTDSYSALVWPAWLVAMYIAYRKYKPDLFMLAGCCLSGIVIIVSFAGKHILEGRANSGSYLFLALLVIGLGTGVAMWLKSIHKEMML